MRFQIEVPETALSALRQTPEDVVSVLLQMAAAKLYEIGQLSQERASELAGQSRQEFQLTLSRLGVSPFQGVEQDLVAIRHAT